MWKKLSTRLWSCCWFRGQRKNSGRSERSFQHDGRIVESLLETARSFDKQDVFESETHEELFFLKAKRTKNSTKKSGFSYIVSTSRTLSHTGERHTLVAVNQLNPLTHSYTIRPLLNMNGNLVGKLYVNLKEVGDEFCPLVSASMPQYSKLHVTCSKSGKLNKKLLRAWNDNVFKEGVNRLNSDKCVLYVDPWVGHSDVRLYETEKKSGLCKNFSRGLHRSSAAVGCILHPPVESVCKGSNATLPTHPISTRPKEWRLTPLIADLQPVPAWRLQTHVAMRVAYGWVRDTGYSVRKLEK